MIKLTGIKNSTQEKETIKITNEDFLKQIKQILNLENRHLNKEGTELGYWRDIDYEFSNYDSWEWKCISKGKNEIEQYKRNKLAYDIIENNLFQQFIEDEWNRLGKQIINYLKIQKFDFNEDNIRLSRTNYDLVTMSNGEEWIEYKKAGDYFIEKFKDEGYSVVWDDYSMQIIIGFKDNISIVRKNK